MKTTKLLTGAMVAGLAFAGSAGAGTIGDAFVSVATDANRIGLPADYEFTGFSDGALIDLDQSSATGSVNTITAGDIIISVFQLNVLRAVGTAGIDTLPGSVDVTVVGRSAFKVANVTTDIDGTVSSFEVDALTSNDFDALETFTFNGGTSLLGTDLNFASAGTLIEVYETTGLPNDGVQSIHDFEDYGLGSLFVELSEDVTGLSFTTADTGVDAGDGDPAQQLTANFENLLISGGSATVDPYLSLLNIFPELVSVSNTIVGPADANPSDGFQDGLLTDTLIPVGLGTDTTTVTVEAVVLPTPTAALGGLLLGSLAIARRRRVTS